MSRVIAIAIVVCTFMMLGLMYFPGFADPDLNAAFYEARQSAPLSFHAPGMTLIVRYLPESLRGLELLSFLPGFLICAALLACIYNSRYPMIFALALVLLLIVSPILQSRLWFAGKDSTALGLLLVAFAFIISSKSLTSGLSGALALIVLFPAILIRYDYILVSFPLVIFSSMMIFRVVSKKKITQLLFSLVFFVIYFSLALFIPDKIIMFENGYPIQQLAVFDIQGIKVSQLGSRACEQNSDLCRYNPAGVNRIYFSDFWPYYPACMPEMNDATRQMRLSGMSDIWSKTCLESKRETGSEFEKPLHTYKMVQILRGAGDSETYDKLQRQWLNLIQDFPLEYFRHRIAFYSRSLEWRTKEVCDPFPPYPPDSRSLLSSFDNWRMPLNDFIRMFNFSIRNTLLFRPWFYFSLLVVALVLSLYCRNDENNREQYLVLGCCGLISFIGPLFYGINCGNRFYLTGIVVSILLLAMLLSQLPKFCSRSPRGRG